MIASLPLPGVPDVVMHDPDLRRLYVAAEDGPLVVFFSDQNGIREVTRGTAGPNAHSVAVDPVTHHIYLPLANVGGHPVLRELSLDVPEGLSRTAAPTIGPKEGA